LSGFNKPSKVNEAVFERTVAEVTQVARNFLGSLVTKSPPRNREVEAAKARARIANRFGQHETLKVRRFMFSLDKGKTFLHFSTTL